MLQIYEKFDADSVKQADHARLEYFTKKVSSFYICLLNNIFLGHSQMILQIITVFADSVLLFVIDIPKVKRFCSGTPVI